MKNFSNIRIQEVWGASFFFIEEFVNTRVAHLIIFYKYFKIFINDRYNQILVNSVFRIYIRTYILIVHTKNKKKY